MSLVSAGFSNFKAIIIILPLFESIIAERLYYHVLQISKLLKWVYQK